MNKKTSYVLFTLKDGVRNRVRVTDDENELRDWYKAAPENFYCNETDYKFMEEIERGKS